MQNLRIHYLQPVLFEGLGSIAEWATSNGHVLTSTKFFIHSDLPEPADIDWLIIMGGPMGVYDEDKYEWLAAAKQFIKEVIDAGKVVIGICLGAQLIAEVLGAKVYPNHNKEIGWYSIELNTEALENKLFKDFDRTLTVFHWHGDTFDVPENAVRLASSQACKNQAFVYNEKVLALQFHFEMTESSLAKMIDNGNEQLEAGPFIQSSEIILSNKDLTEKNKHVLFKILDRLSNHSYESTI